MRLDLGIANDRPGDDLDLALGYDAENAPGPRWLEMEEQERIMAAEAHHARLAAHPEMPNPHLHAVMHVIVENQIASGEVPDTAAAVARLMAGGASRHEAIHAAGSVVAEEIHRVMKEKTPFDREAVARRLRRLRARDWMGTVGR